MLPRCSSLMLEASRGASDTRSRADRLGLSSEGFKQAKISEIPRGGKCSCKLLTQSRHCCLHVSIADIVAAMVLLFVSLAAILSGAETHRQVRAKVKVL